MTRAKFALVTGGNRGIGLEICRQLVAKGKPVLLTARDAKQGQEVANSLVAATPTAVVKCLSLDASKSDSIKELASVVKHEYDQQIDLLINNAGILFRGTWAPEEYELTFKTNSAGPIVLTQALLPHLSPEALVVMVSSTLGQLKNLSSDYKQAVEGAVDLQALQAIPFTPDSAMGNGAPEHGSFAPTYTVSKAILNRAVQLLSTDETLKARGTRIVSICPGWCRWSSSPDHSQIPRRLDHPLALAWPAGIHEGDVVLITASGFHGAGFDVYQA